MVQTWALSVIGTQTARNETQFTPMPRKRMANDAATRHMHQNRGNKAAAILAPTEPSVADEKKRDLPD
jgi:hypothetical protein